MTKIKAALAYVAITVTFVFVLLSAPLRTLHAASSLSISPATSTQTQNANQTFTVSINTDGTDVFGADAYISFPTSAFEYVSAANGTFFPDGGISANAATGTIALHGYIGSTFQYKSGTGTLGTFILKAKAGSGQATIGLTCNTGAQTSQIIDGNGANILSCTSTNQAVVQLTGSSTTVTPSVTPTLPPGIPTATPTGNPGNQEPRCSGLVLSHSTSTKPVTVTFTCSGSDPDNDVTGAEFSFGNGGSRVVDKNVGQYGSISTAYTYSVAGTYLVSCRLRDNNGKYSSTPAICQKSLIVTNSAPTPTPRASGSGSKTTTPIVYTGQSDSPVTLEPYQSPTPTPEIVTVTPTPKTTAYMSSDRFQKLILMVIVSIITIAIAFALLRHFDKE